MTVPEKPLDFLNQEIHIGDFICYPTGGTSCRMVLAKVLKIEDHPDFDYAKAQAVEAADEVAAVQREVWIKTGDLKDLEAYHELYRKRPIYYPSPPEDGVRGPGRYRIQVNRFKEGISSPDSKRKVLIDQLHRVIVLPIELYLLYIEREQGSAKGYWTSG